jgi:hypothetical protein
VLGTCDSTLVILSTRSPWSGGSQFEVNPGKYFSRPYLQKTHKV